MSEPDPKLRVVADGHVARVEIDNGARRNSLDLAMWRALPCIFAGFEADAAIRVIVVTGAGALPFCAGADISEFATMRATAEGGRAYEAANAATFDAIAACAPTAATM